jgi:hypothetical protein
MALSLTYLINKTAAMKKRSLILAIFLIISMIPFQAIVAQDKTISDKEKKDQELNDLIIEQKKALVDQKLSQEEMKKALEKAAIEREKAMQDAKESYSKSMKNYGIIMSDSDRFKREFKFQGDFGKNRFFDMGEPFIVSPDIELYGHLNGDSERTAWDFSKSIKEASFSREYTVDVDQNVNKVVISVNGDCKSGDIRIKISMPNGKAYSDIVIDESGNLNWRKSFTISDTENKDKVGAWKFGISSSKATGYFKISLQAY